MHPENHVKLTDIVIVGYPKSGNTWVTRLVAELVGCPVTGFLNGDYEEAASEGLSRQSIYQCFKSHHQIHELLRLATDARTKIIYVVRDPRDICVSGARYFRFERWPFLGKCIGVLPKGGSIYHRFVNRFVTPSSYRIEKMINAVIHGSGEINCWTRVSWATHCMPYLDNQYFVVRYEDLLCQPERECKRILNFLGLDRDDSQIMDAIAVQSFRKKKQAFIDAGEMGKANFMAVGQKEQWREILSRKHKTLIKNELADELEKFGYPAE